MAAPKSPRKPAFADAIDRKMYDTAKKDLSRTQARIEEERRLEARRALTSNPVVKPVWEIRQASVLGGLMPRLKSVMASYGLDIPVVLRQAGETGGWTDFRKIVVKYNQELVKLANQDSADVSALRQLAGETRGVFYHELGHNRFTVMFDDLLELAGVAKASLSGPETKALHETWNFLEDQRMESAVIEESPHIATYLTVLVLRVIATEDRLMRNYPLLAGRWYLPSAVVKESARRYAAEHGQDQADLVRGCVERYMAATTASDMLAEVVELNSIMGSNDNLHGFDDHEGMGGTAPEGDESDPFEKMQASATDLDEHEDEEDDLEGSGEADDSEDVSDDDDETAGEAPSKGDQDEAGDSEDDDPEDAPGEGSNEDDADDESDQCHGGSDEDSDVVQDALDNALDQWDNDKALDGDITSMNEAFKRGDFLPYYEHTIPSTSELSKATAAALAVKITDAFRTATADAAPRWEYQQRAGNLDVLRYVTRQPGDMEVFRRYEDHGDPGARLKVSVYLDVSVSMDGTGDALGGAAWAVKRAGDNLNIETDVYVFNSQAYTIYRTSDRPEYVPNIQASGGTNPEPAFNATLTEETDRDHHLVLVMTDGEWFGPMGSKALMPHRSDGRTLVLFKYEPGESGDEMKEQVESGLMLNYSPDEAHLISDLFDIPRILQALLVQIGKTQR